MFLNSGGAFHCPPPNLRGLWSCSEISNWGHFWNIKWYICASHHFLFNHFFFIVAYILRCLTQVRTLKRNTLINVCSHYDSENYWTWHFNWMRWLIRLERSLLQTTINLRNGMLNCRNVLYYLAQCSVFCTRDMFSTKPILSGFNNLSIFIFLLRQLF